MNEYERAVVFDYGSARVKLTLCVRQESEDGTIHFMRKKESVRGEGRNITEGEFSTEIASNIDEITRKYKALAVDHGAQVGVAVGTHAFREWSGAEDVVRGIEELLGSLNVISSDAEGALFHRAVGLDRVLEGSYGVLDIGGGTVQLSLSPNVDCVCSKEVGTYALEAQFQKGESVGDRNYGAMFDAVGSRLREARMDLAECPDPEVLFVGTNYMRDFFCSVLLEASEKDLLPYRMYEDAEDGRVYKDTCVQLYSILSDMEYGEAEELFPAFPKFMRGADKSLIVMLSALESLELESFIPVNESVGTGVAELALSREGREELQRFGIKPFLM